MSLPAAAAVLPTIASMNPLDVLMSSINSNPYFIGIMMLLLNLGGRFLSLEVSKEQEKFLSTPLVRRFLLFAVLFVATRNILIAAVLTVVMILIIGYLFNENSDLCLWHSCAKKTEEKAQVNYTGLTAEEVMILKRLQDKQAGSVPEAGDAGDAKDAPVNVKEPSASSVYASYLSMLR
jgi:hypothetical protein